MVFTIIYHETQSHRIILLKLLSHDCDNRVYGANFQETFRRREEIIGLELCRINRKVLSSPRQTSSIASKCRGLVSEKRRGKEGEQGGLGSDIDLVVNFSAPAGLVATFVCTRGLWMGWTRNGEVMIRVLALRVFTFVFTARSLTRFVRAHISAVERQTIH